jgi:hypothetical protein
MDFDVDCTVVVRLPNSPPLIQRSSMLPDADFISFIRICSAVSLFTINAIMSDGQHSTWDASVVVLPVGTNVAFSCIHAHCIVDHARMQSEPNNLQPP